MVSSSCLTSRPCAPAFSTLTRNPRHVLFVLALPGPARCLKRSAEATTTITCHKTNEGKSAGGSEAGCGFEQTEEYVSSIGQVRVLVHLGGGKEM
eukprot:765945-Prorocentrum_minimum.AAC.1